MNTIKISKNDLKGYIENFPIEIVEMMVKQQVKQGNKADVTVFYEDGDAVFVYGGFDWSKTKDGSEFWYNVIRRKHFDEFFERYPKMEEEESKFVYIVGDNDYGDVIIAELERHGGINKHRYSGDNKEWLYYIDPVTNIIEYCDTDEVFDNKLYEMLMTFYTPIELVIVEEDDKIVEVSMEEIAKMMGVDVSNLRIKE